VALELKKLREERKNKKKNKALHPCRLCKVTCNSRRVYQEDLQLRKPKKRRRNWKADRAVTSVVTSLSPRPTSFARQGQMPPARCH
jgi:hypothetical protein